MHDGFNGPKYGIIAGFEKYKYSKMVPDLRPVILRTVSLLYRSSKLTKNPEKCCKKPV